MCNVTRDLFFSNSQSSFPYHDILPAINHEQNKSDSSTNIRKDDDQDDSTDEILPSVEHFRQNYFASLDASLDLLVRNTICSSLVNARAANEAAAASATTQKNVQETQNSVRKDADKHSISKSSLFTIENLIKKG